MELISKFWHGRLGFVWTILGLIGVSGSLSYGAAWIGWPVILVLVAVSIWQGVGAVIFVADSAENQIVLFGGSNQAFTTDQIETALKKANPKTDWVICQNETNLVHELAQSAKSKNLRVAYSAAPFEAEHAIPMLDHIDLLAVNEVEAAALQAALGKDPRDIGLRYLLVTKGAEGADLHTHHETIHQPSFKVSPQDTTGAGDTFLGAFMAEFTLSNSPAKALRFAAAASAIQVTRAGAAPAIPLRDEVLTFLKEHA
ncbi:PfkB family carbohydrate kinase [Amylibacter sp.]|nr:PfkB family carbohydrate kinase [Amylibacter sp.]